MPRHHLAFLATLLILTICRISAQNIVYSQTEKISTNGNNFQVIGKFDGRILAFREMIAPEYEGFRSYVRQTAIYVLDNDLRFIEEIKLPLPYGISAVHFVAYPDFFYIFFRRQKDSFVYWMVAKIGKDGRMIGNVITLYKVFSLGLPNRSSFFSVAASDNKEYITVYRVDYNIDSNTVIRTLLFDRDLHLLHTSYNNLGMAGSQFIQEFRTDDQGNFLFVGLSRSNDFADLHQSLLFMLPRGSDSLRYTDILPLGTFVENVRLLIDNRRGRYILSAFYSDRPRGDILGLYSYIGYQDQEKPPAIIITNLSDSFRQALRPNMPVKKAFNTIYLLDMHLRQDGGIEITTEDRPSRLQFFISDFGFSGKPSLIFSCDSTGVAEWINQMDFPVPGPSYTASGYKLFTANGLIFFLYPVGNLEKTFLTAAGMDANGELHTDARLKPDVTLPAHVLSYRYDITQAKQVDEGEVIVPCSRKGYLYLARIDLN
jgi:hypothetical protein